MNKISSNPCVRCGKERIILKTWKEKIDNSTVTTTEMICPDKDCQKKVDLDNKRQRDKSAALRFRSEQRALHRKAVKDAERIAKVQ